MYTRKVVHYNLIAALKRSSAWLPSYLISMACQGANSRVRDDVLYSHTSSGQLGHLGHQWQLSRSSCNNADIETLRLRGYSQGRV